MFSYHLPAAGRRERVQNSNRRRRMERNLVAVGYHGLLFPIARYRTGHDIIPRFVSPVVVVRIGFAKLHKAPEVKSTEARADENQAIQFGNVIAFDGKFNDGRGGSLPPCLDLRPSFGLHSFCGGVEPLPKSQRGRHRLRSTACKIEAASISTVP